MKNYLQRQQTFAPRIRKWGKENDGSLYNSNNLLRREGLNCASLILGTVSRSYALIHDVARQCWPCFAREWSWPKEPFSLSLSILNSLVRSFVHSFSSVVIAPTLYIPLRRACSFSRRAPRFEWAEPTKRRWFSAIQRFLLLLLFGAAVIAAGVAEAAAAAVFVVDHLESLSGFFDIHLSDYAYVSGGNIYLNEEKKERKISDRLGLVVGGRQRTAWLSRTNLYS